MIGFRPRFYHRRAIVLDFPKGKTVELPEPKPKTITIAGTTNFYARGDAATKMAFSDIKLGMRVSIVGKDMGRRQSASGERDHAVG
jgi:hypothetical protein